MNYLHHNSNFDWTGAHSYRNCAGMTFIHEISNLRNTHYTHAATNILKEMVKNHKNRKVRWWQPKIGKFKIANNVLELNKYGYVTIDGRQVAFDSSLMYWFISEYNFDWNEKYAVIVDIMHSLFKVMHDDIVENYEFYCTSDESEIRLEKLLCMYLIAKSGLEFTDKKYKNYDEIDRHVYKRNGIFNDQYLLAEDMINKINGTNFTFARDFFDDEYNNKMNKGVSDICKEIIKTISL